MKAVALTDHKALRMLGIKKNIPKDGVYTHSTTSIKGETFHSTKSKEYVPCEVQYSLFFIRKPY